MVTSQAYQCRVSTVGEGDSAKEGGRERERERTEDTEGGEGKEWSEMEKKNEVCVCLQLAHCLLFPVMTATPVSNHIPTRMCGHANGTLM